MPNNIAPNQFAELPDFHIMWLTLSDGTEISVQPHHKQVEIVHWNADGESTQHCFVSRHMEPNK